MVGRISPQTPEPGTHQPCSETLCTAHYSLATLLAAQTKQLPPSSASRSANISPVLSSFRILPVATGVYPASFPRFRRSDLQTCQRFCLQELAASLPSFASPRPLFSMACSLFLQNARVGVCPQTRRLKSIGSSLLRLLRASRAHSVLNSWLSCLEAGLP
jgi:hypothetical protein